VRNVGAWIENINKQITQTTNHLEKLVYQTFPELLVYCRHGFPDWLLNLLQKYTLPTDVIIPGKNRVRKIDFVSEARVVAAKVASHTGDFVRSSVASSCITAANFAVSQQHLIV
jgi:hypothetical protein